jgi:uracil-DNA glycosylase
MERGLGRDILVIGIEPGSTEVKQQKAFSGPAGKRLIGWLEAAGLGSTRQDVLQRSYLTSLTKCTIKTNSRRRAAVSNCYRFLERQIELIRPKVCVTLGLEPFTLLFETESSMEGIVGERFIESDLRQTLIPLLPEGCTIIPLPHPSPLSRWLNDAGNKRKLEKALELLRQELQKP